MWEFIRETINALPGNWSALGWIAFLAISVAVIAGLAEALKLFCEWAFDAISNGVEIAATKFAEGMAKLIRIPFLALGWLGEIIWLKTGLYAKYIHGAAIDYKLKAARDRDLRAYYNKHRNKFKDWDHFRRWMNDEEGARESPSPQSRDHYKDALAMLGLEQGFSEQEFKTAYRRLSSFVHPDRGCPTDYFSKQVNDAVRLIRQRRNWR